MLDPTSASWQRLDAFLAARSRRWVVAVGVGLVVTLWRTSRGGAEPLSLVLGMGLLIALIHADIWLWRSFRAQLMSNPTDPFVGFVYGRGVFLFGVLFWLAMALAQAYRWAGARHPPYSLEWMEAAAFFLLPSLAIGLIFALAGGYYWGRLMASIFRLRRRKVS